MKDSLENNRVKVNLNLILQKFLLKKIKLVI